MNDNPSCPNCGSYAVTPTTAPVDGQCEYRCDDCGEYFVAEAGEDA
jgi:transposase-like protein